MQNHLVGVDFEKKILYANLYTFAKQLWVGLLMYTYKQIGDFGKPLKSPA